MALSNITTDDLQALRARVLRDNPLARADVVLGMKLFRMALRESGVAWENAAFDRCFTSLVLRERRDEQPIPSKPVYEPPTPPRPTPMPQPSPEDRAKDFIAGKSKYERAKDGITAARFPNGRDILNQTVGDIQKLGTWTGAILQALPKTAKLTDRIGQYLTLDQLTKLRTFDV